MEDALGNSFSGTPEATNFLLSALPFLYTKSLSMRGIFQGLQGFPADYHRTESGTNLPVMMLKKILMDLWVDGKRINREVFVFFVP